MTKGLAENASSNHATASGSTVNKLKNSVIDHSGKQTCYLWLKKSGNEVDLWCAMVSLILSCSLIKEIFILIPYCVDKRQVL
jgi:hypothetical protein